VKAVFHDAAVNLAAHPVGWPLARLARRLGGVLRVPGLGLVVSDAEFGHEVLMRDADFTKNGPGSLSRHITASLGPFALANMDGEAHQRLRGKLKDVVTPGHSRELLRGCGAPIADLQRRLRAGETVDLVRWMRALSGRITYDMLGLVAPTGREEAAYLDLVALGERISTGLDFRDPKPARLESLAVDCRKLADHARIGYDAPDTPDRSFVRRLRELGLTFDEARGVISLIFIAGTLTTSAAVPRLLALLHDSDALRALRRDRTGVANAIAEGLRFTTPVPATARIAARATSVQRVAIGKDERVVILTCNLARDPNMFADPDRFDPARVHPPRARHLWFGAGAHFCLGFAVAQFEMQMVLDALLDLEGDLRVVRRKAARNVLVPAYARLDVRLERSAS
jgi:cytochrome P450